MIGIPAGHTEIANQSYSRCAIGCHLPISGRKQEAGSQNFALILPNQSQAREGIGRRQRRAGRSRKSNPGRRRRSARDSVRLEPCCAVLVLGGGCALALEGKASAPAGVISAFSRGDYEETWRA